MSDANLTTLLDEMEQATDDDTTTVADILKALGDRSFGPVLFVIGLMAISPLGAIPGASLLLALLTAVVAAQLVAGQDHIWLPDGLRSVEVKSSRLKSALASLRKPLRTVAFLVSERVTQALAEPMPRIAGGVAILLALSMVPLVVVPGGVVPASLIVMCIGLALAARDGALLVLALVLSAVIFGATAFFVV